MKGELKRFGMPLDGTYENRTFGTLIFVDNHYSPTLSHCYIRYHWVGGGRQEAYPYVQLRDPYENRDLASCLEDTVAPDEKSKWLCSIEDDPMSIGNCAACREYVAHRMNR
jgi:hypothetical protein